jgi:hypothetical protein
MNRQEELSELSDFDISKIIAKKLGREFYVTTLNSDEPYLMCPKRDEEIDYCDNPGDIMPIAFEHEISINCLGELDDDCVWWEASPPSHLFDKCECKNPLRAICIVFILMMEAK